eukprot:gene4528-8992_t
MTSSVVFGVSFFFQLPLIKRNLRHFAWLSSTTLSPNKTLLVPGVKVKVCTKWSAHTLQNFAYYRIERPKLMKEASSYMIYWYIMITALLAINILPPASCDESKKKPLSKFGVIDLLKEKLDPIRQHLKLNGSSTPEMLYRVDDSKNNSEPSTHVICLPLPANVDLIGLISHWVSIIKKTDDDKISIESSSHNNHNYLPSIKNGTFLSFIASDNTSSIVLESSPRPMISVYKDGGFTSEDVQHITNGYAAALSTTNSNFSGISRRNLLDENLPKIFGFLDKNNNDRDSIQISRSKDNTDNSINHEDPVGQLRAMGIEVYDNESNVGLDWDSLAGYDNIKRDIEDTIIYAIQHPEVYDSIAKKTRANYSQNCNCPKAVLFEGPP